MGKASSAKKVARAASVGESRRVGERRLIGFPAAVVLTIVLGVGLVAFAAGTRNAPPTPTLQDHWHSAYGIYDCQVDDFEEPLEALVDAQGRSFDPDGIHSHEDGLMHVHPFTSNVTGSSATFGVFFETVGVVMDDDVLTTPNGEYRESDITCDGQPAELQVLRWNDASTAETSEPDEIITENFNDIRYEKDAEAFTVAIAPVGADIPPPPTIARLITVNPTLLAPDTGNGGGADVGDAELVPLDDSGEAEADADTGDAEADTGDADADTDDAEADGTDAEEDE